ncbi:MAG: maltose alpha-D-glucosyltransferase [Acidimicrobiales bacterium]
MVAQGPTAHWYQDAVLYETHVRAFADSNGDGIGDFPGLVERLDYIQELGVTALWLLPFYPSPWRDDGYDISDYRQVHPAYGTLRDFRTLLREAHRRGLRVITELVLNHTSDEHPWFQRARRSRPGTSARDFYVWSDDPNRYGEARIIFKDFETSNWAWDAEAKAYFWHRFYAHQPNLNYDHAPVRQAMFDVVDYWLGMGVDGLRLDAIPYLYAREGTTCENLPQVFEFLRSLRSHIDDRFQDRMLLAEANQWPEDAVEYMGKGDMCQMAFHFPLMPRMFMAARQEDRFPIVDILTETPPTPPDSQWALFLRNHDELTLEMVTDEERDYMYRVYAQDPQARVNVGIRRRLAPLLGNDRTMIEMMNGLLFSLPGTPIVYYGDEIGMGDNIYLGDRDAVRTPMQWDSDRNAGFSRANPQRLFLPVIIDPEYHFQAVNVEAQDRNPSSLLWWMRRVISLRGRYRAFGRGSLELLRPENRKVLAFLRRYEDELILVVANLSRFTQCVELDLSEFRGAVPVELFGNLRFPPVGDLPYFITVGPHGFYWFALECEPDHDEAPRPSLALRRSWTELLTEPGVRALESVLPAFLAGRRWFVSKTRAITRVSARDSFVVPAAGGGDPSSAVVIVEVELDYGGAETYLLPLAYAQGVAAKEIHRWRSESIVCDLTTGRDGSGGEDGVLYDAVYEPEFSTTILEVIARRRSISGSAGRLVGSPTPIMRELRAGIGPEVRPVPVAAEQSNSSVIFGDQAILKYIRRVESGVNPGIEVGRFLGERARFGHSPRTGGSLEYRPDGTAPLSVVAALEEFVPNEGDGWSYVVDALEHGLEEVMADSETFEPDVPPPAHALDVPPADAAAGHPLLGPHLAWASLLGRRTAELHMALAGDHSDPAFRPEPLTAGDRQSLFHGARSSARRVLRQAAGLRTAPSSLDEVLRREGDVYDRLRSLSTGTVQAEKIRCHGDYHLGQVLWTGRDFIVVDFEGEPARSLGQRRLKRPGAFDLAGMIRSFHYASRAAAARLERDHASIRQVAALESWLYLWHRWVSGTFLHAYVEVAGGAGFVPRDRSQLAALLDFFLLEKAVYELGYEVNSRPDWVDIPARGIIDILDSAA